MIKYNFTEKQAMEFYSLYLGGLSCTQIAKQQACAVGTITNLFKKYNLQIENRASIPNIDLQTLITEYKSGKSLTQIGKEYHTNRHILSKKLKAANIPVINEQNKLRFNENIFDVIDNEEKAYWLGFIWADGNISKQVEGKKKDYRFEISVCEEDYDHLVKFNQFVEYSGTNVKKRVHRLNDKEFVSYRWMISNKHLWQTLNSYGCIPKKSLVVKFPDKNIFSNPTLIHHFIRGYFDGDGCIFCYKNNPGCSVVGTENVLKTIQTLILNDTNALHQNHSNDVRTKVYSINGVKALAFMYALYYGSNVSLNRKYKLFLYFKNCRFKAKALKLLEGKIGEGWDANPELIADLNDLQQCNA